VYAGRRGERRDSARSWWDRARLEAGLPELRWHDLRHTCAVALLAGWWGRRWSLDEIGALLGHSTVRVTERYAHRLQSTLWAAAASTPAHVRPSGQNGKGTDDDGE
jgi:integrase